MLALGHELAMHRKFDLEHMRVLAAALGNPQRRFPAVLIAGTNGKGSTAATLASILRAAGYSAGLYTSPHLVRINERIQLNGEPISDPEFTEMFTRVEGAAEKLVAVSELPWHPSFFEMMTAIMFEYFASAGVQIAVLEVGMGGRLDATNIADPLLSVITDIDYDHQKFLGETLPEIAREKAGILRRGVPAVLLPQHPQVNDTLGKAILETGARPVSAVHYMPPVSPEADAQRSSAAVPRSVFPVEFRGERIVIDSPLYGRHQFRNLALALTAADELNTLGFPVSAQQAAAGVRHTQWPGRFQVLPGRPETVLDVAHNPAGAWALRSALSASYPDRPLTFVFGAMRDKAISEIAAILFPMADRVIATQADNPRAASTSEIAEAAAPFGADLVQEPGVEAALRLARERAGSNGIVVVTGSIYLVGAAIAILDPALAGQRA